MQTYSNSRISSFENCPLQYRYRYIDRIKRQVQGVEAHLGKVVHEVLETLYADLDRARAAGVEEFTALFRDLWRRTVTPEVRIVREGMTLDDYRSLGERCVETFYRRNHPFRNGEVLGCEIKVEFSLDAAGQYRILGFIDRVDRISPGVFEIHDYKTGGLPRYGALKKDRQLSLYEMAVRERWIGVKEVRQIWHYLAHGREFVEKRGADYLHKTRLSAIRAIEEIEATTEFPPRRSPLCSWCEYVDICPEWSEQRQSRTPPQAPPDVVPDVDPHTGQYLLFGGASEK